MKSQLMYFFGNARFTSMLAGILLASCSFVQRQAEFEPVSIVRLIAVPDQMHGTMVTVAGWIHLDFEDMSLCLAEKVPSAKECIWIELDASSSQPKMKEWSRYSGRIVIVRGTFDKELKGHLGGWSGGLSGIVEIEPFPSRPK